MKVYATGVTLNEIVWIWKNQNQNITLPIILGHELSGIVSELGSRVTDLKIGEAIFGLTDPTVPVRGGTEAEYVIARSLELAAKPTSLDHVIAAGVPINGMTYLMACIVGSWPIVWTRYRTYSWGCWSCR